MKATKSLFLARYGALGAFAAFLPSEAFHVVMQSFEASRGTVLASTSIWTAILAVACGTALVIGQNKYLRRPFIDLREAGLALGGGAVAGAAAGFLAEYFFQIAVAIGNGNALLVETARILAWGILGALTGVGMSFMIPNLGHARGGVAGAVGGSIGAVGFIISGLFLGVEVGRLLGTTSLGFALGYAIGLAEEVARTAWLDVRYGRSGEAVKVSLGAEPVYIGSNSQRCAIWAQGARPVALRFRYIDGQIFCDDIAQESTAAVEPGFEVEVGNIRLITRAGGRQEAGSASAPSSRSPPPPPPPPPLPPRPIPAPMSPRTAARGDKYASPKSALGVPGKSPPPPPPPPPPPRRG